MNREEKYNLKKLIIIAVITGIITGLIIFIIGRNAIFSLLMAIITMALIILYTNLRKSLKKSEKIRKYEDVFPDFLQLMSSNLRAGMTIDKALLLSSRPEFAPLDQEIFQTGKDLTTGKSVERALLDMSKRMNSDKIYKTILLIISGIRAGGDVAILLEQTAVNMRERGFVEKRAASSVLMYVIFIFLAVAIFAPALFSLSTVLVEVLTNIMAGLPATTADVNLPFSISKINISVNFIKYFSIIFMIVIDIFSALVLGLVRKGEEKEGLKQLPVILLLSFSIFFLARIFIIKFMGGLL